MQVHAGQLYTEPFIFRTQRLSRRTETGGTEHIQREEEPKPVDRQNKGCAAPHS